MAICKGCGDRPASEKSHIVPASFFRSMNATNTPLVEISSRSKAFPKRRPIGYYDTSILCQECEKKFAPHDDFGQQILIQRRSELLSVEDRKKVLAQYLNDVDTERFKRFLVSVLWRASVSGHSAFSKAHIGPFEKRAKELSWGGVFASREEFAFIGFKYREEDASDLVLSPHRLRNSGVNFMSLYLPRYAFWIKVDQRPMPERLSKIGTTYPNQLVLISKSMHESEEYSAVLNIVQRTIERMK